MDDATLAELERLAGAATPGPWKARHSHGIDETGEDPVAQPAWLVLPNIAALGYRDYRVVCRTVRTTGPDESADAGFIAAARSAVPALCAEVRRLRAELAAEREACAREADRWATASHPIGLTYSGGLRFAAKRIAEAIRARGELAAGRTPPGGG